MSDHPALFGDLPDAVPLKLQIACVEREIEKRKSVYPRLVDRGTMTPGKMSAELAGMRAVLKTLQELAQREGR